MQEVWKDIQGYEGLYQVSNLGNVRSLDRIVTRKGYSDYVIIGKNLNFFDNGRGYKTLSLCKGGKVKKEYVHRLVARAFVSNPLNYFEVNHKDENTSNNNADNLEWCDRKSNMNYGNRAKKYGVSRGKPVICIETGLIYHSVREATRQTGVHPSDISGCCLGRGNKTAGGYHWAFVEALKEEH